MPTAGPRQAASSARVAWLGGAFGTLLVALGMAWLWGFTVDDALISCRVAENLARGLGYRFNEKGPVVDAVTPLGWAPLLALFAGGGELRTLHAAKWLGALTTGAATLWLLRRIFLRAQPSHALALTLCLALTAPFTAWAVSGMETGLVTALCILALGSGACADGAAALAAALRPELAPWCACVRLGLRLAGGVPLNRAFGAPVLVLGAVFLVGALRSFFFGHAAPLALLAKPSDLSHGASYAAHALVQTGLPVLCLAPLSLGRASGVARTVTLAGGVHFVALALAGGDWMSLYRLAAPVLPSFVLGAAELSRVAARWASWLRASAAGALSGYLALAVGPAARLVGPDRAALIAQGRRALAGARVVAALDVGWVGAATQASVVDLAGVTDPTIAALRGGHTSKRIDDSVLRQRDVDAVVLLESRAPPGGYDREVERRVALLPSMAAFRLTARLPLADGRQHYAVLRAF